MAGKHSKKFFDFSKSIYVTAPNTKTVKQKPLSLCFKVIIATLVISLVLSSVLVGNFFLQSSAHRNLLADAAAVFEAGQSGEAIKTLSEKNKDIKGWLKIEGADINYAVCQSDDDRFYINHNQLGKKSRYGALFLSANDTFERKGNDHNIVIFGNNMKDGTMFGSLKKYRNLNFYKQNPCIELYYGEEVETYVIFSVMLVSSSADDSGEVYKPYKSYFADNAEFDGWLKESYSRSLINTTVEAEYGDDILTLVTVADDFEGARLVIMAKKTDEWDAAHTEVGDAAVNPQIKYPKIWYTTRGLKYPY
ncbi:MAG: class B sortase [Clostridia bacterium]|nr:class B sortase [Clostridia bacterium]